MCVELKRRRFERVWAVGLAPGSERETKGDSAASEAALNASGLFELANDKGKDIGESEKAIAARAAL